MKKYKQTRVPATNSQWHGKPNAELRKLMLAYYKQHLAGRTVRNRHKGITVEFTISVGGRKVTHGGALYTAKVEGMRLAAELLAEAEYLNFGPAKPTDNPNVLGYLNFKAVGRVDGRQYTYKLNVLLRNDGKFFYNLDTPRKPTGPLAAKK